MDVFGTVEELIVFVEPELPDVQISVSDVGIVGPPGPPGKDAESFQGFSYQMPVAQTTAVVNHNLGRDPIAIQVFDNSQLCDEYSVVFTIPGEQVTLGFDVSVAALIRLL